MRWLAPKLTVGITGPSYLPVYWGDAAAKFRWDLAARPKTALLRAGGFDQFPGLGSMRVAGAYSPLDNPTTAVPVEGPLLGEVGAVEEKPSPPLSSVPPEQRADFLADLYLAARPQTGSPDPLVDDPFVAPLADAAAIVAADWFKLIAAEPNEQARVARLMDALETELSGDKLLQQGGFADWMTKAGETLKRAAHWPADAVSTVLAESRPVLNELVAYFIGDVLAYINDRGDPASAPGEIPRRVLVALKQAHQLKETSGERIIVVTHSMGGQLLYDAVTFYALADPDLAGLEIDHWITCGCQVSFFAELGLFKGQPATAKPLKLRRPKCVSVWTNYYDRNDLVGFIMEPVFDGVNDIEYDTGYGLAFAHTGFLARPSFFSALAERVGSN
jgi:hypothetical protein